MSQVDSKNGIHWPSIFWFSIAIYCIALGIIDSTLSNVVSGIGFCFMGYSSIRLIPANFFTQKLSLSVTPNEGYRKLDVIIQFLGFVFILSGLIVSQIYT
jgi:hypothetical protein